MTDGQSGHCGEYSALISCQCKSLALGLKQTSQGGRDEETPFSHAVQHRFHELETFTVTVPQGENPHLSAGGLARQNLGQRGKGGFYWGAVRACVCVCICAQVYTNLPSSAQLCVTSPVLLNSGSKSSVPVSVAIWYGQLWVMALLLLNAVSGHGAQQSLDWTSPFHFARFSCFDTSVN